MTVALILVSVALAVTLGLLFFGNRGANNTADIQNRLEAEAKARANLQADLERKRKELDEHRAQLTSLKEQLKLAKRKLYEEKEAGREGDSLAKARIEVERTASLQLERTREELASALAEIHALRAERDELRKRAPSPAAPVVAEAAPTAASEEAKRERRYRELSPAEREKLERLEHQANKDRARAAEVDKELKRIRAKMETQHRIYVVTKGEFDLLRDKYKALEKRLNRTLLEKDLLKRALADLEQKTGMAAGRVEPTAQEIAASDQKAEQESAVQGDVSPMGPG